MAEVPGKFNSRPRFAILTPRGRGAIATIAMRGNGSLGVIGRRFVPMGGQKLIDCAIGRAVYGRFRSSSATEEDVVVGIVADGEVEIHCHGGEAAARAIGEALVVEGGEELSAQDWIDAVVVDRISSAAWMALENARTERAAAILLDQERGALREELKRIGRFLEQGDIPQAKERIGQLLRWSDLGRHLTEPWKVVFAGRPNVGKSSLMNAILGYERSIVWPEPGTTRDVLVATTAIDGWWVELSDVAGLRASGEVIEAAGIARAEQQIEAADLVVFVADATAAWDEELYRSVCGRVKKFVVVAHNKCDLAGATMEGRPVGVATSAVTGLGVTELCSAVVKGLVPESPMRGAAVPFVEEQVRGLEIALAELERGNLEAAGDAIGCL